MIALYWLALLHLGVLTCVSRSQPVSIFLSKNRLWVSQKQIMSRCLIKHTGVKTALTSLLRPSQIPYNSTLNTCRILGITSNMQIKATMKNRTAFYYNDFLTDDNDSWMFVSFSKTFQFILEVHAFQPEMRVQSRHTHAIFSFPISPINLKTL